MSQMELDFTTPEPVLYPEQRVRKTGGHSRSATRPQHVYIRLTERDRRRYNQIVGGFKHFLGRNATGADVFEKYGIPAMAAALKELAEKHRQGKATD